MTALSILVKILIFLVLGLTALLFAFQSKLLFYPTKLEQNFTFKFTKPVIERFIKHRDDQVHALFFKVANPKARIIYFHGNGGALDSWGHTGQEISEKLNCDIMVVDYPGYGKSTGAIPSNEVALYESAEAAFDDLNKLTDSTIPLIIYGRSLGSAVASYLATKTSAQALVLETPYTSMKAMAKLLFPYVPSFLVRYDLDNVNNIKDLALPILVIHGTADSVVPYAQGKELAATNKNINFVTIENGNHNDLANFPRYWAAVSGLVSQFSH